MERKTFRGMRSGSNKFLFFLRRQKEREDERVPGDEREACVDACVRACISGVVRVSLCVA